MSSSTNTRPQIASSQAQKEVTANGLFDMASPAMGFGRDFETTSGLTWGYGEATAPDSDGTPTHIAKGTKALTDNATNYIYYVPSTGAVTKVTSPPAGWPGPMTDKTALYDVTTSSGAVTSYNDWRMGGGGGSGGTTPTGTGFRHVTSGTEDGASKLVDTADINDAQVTLAKMADVATSSVFYRKTAGTGAPEVQTLATLKTDLGLTGTNSGDQTITLTGDVTGTGTGSFATAIGNDKVTNAMLANMGAHTIKGNNTGSSGDPIDLTLAQARAELAQKVVISAAYAATITIDLTSYASYDKVIVDITLTGDATVNITNGTDAQTIILRIRQDGSGSHLFTAGANLRYSASVPVVVLSTAASKLDYIGLEWNGTDSRADVLAYNLGY